MKYSVSEFPVDKKNESYQLIQIDPTSLSRNEKNELSKYVYNNFKNIVNNKAYLLENFTDLRRGSLVILYSDQDEVIVAILKSISIENTEFGDILKRGVFESVGIIKNGNLRRFNGDLISEMGDEGMASLNYEFKNGMRSMSVVQDDIIIDYIDDPGLFINFI